MELLTFRLRAGATEDELRVAETRVYEDFAMHQRGIVRRTTARSDDGEWLVVQLWYDLASADAAASAAADHPATVEMLALAEPASVATRRYEDLGG